MKCLKIARLQDFTLNTPGLLGALSGPQTLCHEVCDSHCESTNPPLEIPDFGLDIHFNFTLAILICNTVYNSTNLLNKDTESSIEYSILMCELKDYYDNITSKIYKTHALCVSYIDVFILLNRLNKIVL